MLSRFRGVLVVAALAVAMWVLEIFDVLLGNPLDTFGIHPRTVDDLWAIFTAPFLHYGFSHLIANSVPFLVLGSLVALSGLGRFMTSSLIIIAISGLGVWLVAPSNSVTLGASGLIFGYFGYLAMRGLIERRTMNIVIMICVIIFYGTMIFGVLPQQQGVSWQAHLFGFVGGLFAAYTLPKGEKQRPVAQGPAGSPGGYLGPSGNRYGSGGRGMYGR